MSIIERVKTKKKLIFIALFLLVGIVIGTKQLTSKEDQVSFITTSVERTTLIDSVSATGNVLNTGQQVVTTQATGIVKEVFVKDGAGVKIGDNLVEIELSQAGKQKRAVAWASYISAKNDLATSERNKLSLQKDVEDAKSKRIAAEQAFDENTDSTDFWDRERRKRWEDLQSSGTALTLAEKKYASSDDGILEDKAGLTVAWNSYQLTSPIIKSPYNGRVSDLLVAQGMIISNTSLEDQSRDENNILTIVGEQPLILSVSISEIDITKIQTEQKVSITVDSILNKTFTGKVVGVDRTGSIIQGVVAYSALVALDTTDRDVLPNMSVTTEIILSSKTGALVVPPSAITQLQEQAVVRILVNGESQDREVEIGLQTLTQVEIVSGLKEGEVVITGERRAGDEPSAFGRQGGTRGTGGGGLRPGGFGDFRGGGDNH